MQRGHFQETLERLVSAKIELLPLAQIEKHWVFSREGFASLVERTADGGFGRIGAPGLLTEKGMAMLVERGGRRVFVAKGLEQPATPDQVESMRRFARDLEAALQSGS